MAKTMNRGQKIIVGLMVISSFALALVAGAELIYGLGKWNFLLLLTAILNLLSCAALCVVVIRASKKDLNQK